MGWLRQYAFQSQFNSDMERIKPEIRNHLDTLTNEIAAIQTSQGPKTVPVFAVNTIETTNLYHRVVLYGEEMGGKPTYFSVYGGTELVSVRVSDTPRQGTHETIGGESVTL
jgi:hypothetical protein